MARGFQEAGRRNGISGSAISALDGITYDQGSLRRIMASMYSSKVLSNSLAEW